MKLHPRSPLSTRIAVAAVLACLAPPALHAADRFWIDPLGGPFSTTTNWSATEGGASGASVPVTADIASFTLNNTYTVTFSTGVTNLGTEVRNGNVTFDLGGSFTYTLTTAADVGGVSGQTGRLTVREGILAVNTTGDEIRIGGDSGATGFMTVTTGGRIGDGTNRPAVNVGYEGTGTLTVNDNGRIDASNFTLGAFPGGTGTATITGPNAVVDAASTMFVGNAGSGTLSVLNGGTFASGGAVTVGDELGIDGTATVSGAGSSWTISSTTTIGNSGDGALTISSGGLVSSTGAVTLGSTATGVGTATVTGTNSRWNLSLGQTIGSNGLGVMTLSSGGQVASSFFANLGQNAGGEGRVTVTGVGSRWTLGTTLTAGGTGTGDLTISAGGEVSAGDVTLGFAASGIGVATVTGTGSKLTSTGTLRVATNGTGTLNVASGAVVDVVLNLFVNDPVGAPVGTFNLDGGSVFVAGTFANNGVFNFTDGLLQVKGDFQPSALPASLVLGSADNGGLTTLDLIGTGATTNVVDLNVGSVGRAQLLLRQGRVLNVGGNFISIGALAGGEGTISVQSGAQLLSTGDVDVGGSGVILGGTGTLNVAGGTVDVGTLRILSPGIVNLSSGTLAVNSAPTLSGQFNWTGGTLRFDAAFSLTSANVPKLLGLDATLGAGQILASSAVMTLQTPVVVDGGALNPSSLINESILEVRSGSASVAGTTTNSPGGQLFVQRDLSLGGTLSNNAGARIELLGGTGRLLGAGVITNGGLVTGDGTITNPFNNVAGGEVRAEFGKTLYFTGATGANTGRLNLLGGTLSFAQQFTNSAATGQINGEGALYFPTLPVPSNASPNAGLMNAGNINLTGGDSQIYGTVQMQTGSRLIVSGGATASFFDVFRHSGIEVRASAGSNIVFFGEVRGAGSFTGTGTIYFEGGYSPGNSPASVLLGTDVIFGDGNTLTLELGGLMAGSEYDQLILGPLGSLALDGELVLDLINGFVPHLGDTFQVLDFDPEQLSGAFDEITFADALPGDLSFDTSGLSTAGTITVVPEPGIGALLLASLVLLGARRRH